MNKGGRSCSPIDNELENEMKRNQSTVRTVRKSKKDGKSSTYAAKVANGNQMYGPGCCAHRVTDAQLQAAKKNASKVANWA